MTPQCGVMSGDLPGAVEQGASTANNFRQAECLAAPQLLSRSPPRASRAGSLPKVPALKRSTLHARSKHA
jgi:hypothetical protein